VVLNKKGDKHDESVVKRVSRKHDDEGHGGAWKVAFADFCMALMCLFLVLWVLAARNSEQLNDVQQLTSGSVVEGGTRQIEAIANGQQGSLIERFPIPAQAQTRTARDNVANGGDADVGEMPHLTKRKLSTPEDMGELSALVKRLTDEAGLAGNLRIDLANEGLRVMFHDSDGNGMFARGSAMPTDNFRALLHKLGPLFAQIDNRMLVIGHTDSVQYADRGHSGYSNWTLSNQRAMAARLGLLDGGMSGDSVLQVIGMADRAPLDAANPASGVNRRIELLILTDAEAAHLASAFGMPGQSNRLVEGVESNLPSKEALQMLHGGAGAHAHPATASGRN
jgi:chemotaxis protein MotB